MAQALPLLPADDFELGLQVIHETADDSRFDQFESYLRSHWLPSKLLISS